MAQKVRTENIKKSIDLQKLVILSK